MIAIYTDCSTNAKRACASYIVLNFETNIYLCSGIWHYDTNKSSVGEIYAVRDVLNYLISTGDYSSEDVTVFTDFAFIEGLFKKHTAGQTIYHPVYREIIDMSKKFKSFCVKHVRSHVSDMTPNKACDILARRFR